MLALVLVTSDVPVLSAACTTASDGGSTVCRDIAAPSSSSLLASPISRSRRFSASTAFCHELARCFDLLLLPLPSPRSLRGISPMEDPDCRRSPPSDDQRLLSTAVGPAAVDEEEEEEASPARLLDDDDDDDDEADGRDDLAAGADFASASAREFFGCTGGASCTLAAFLAGFPSLPAVAAAAAAVPGASPVLAAHRLF